MQKTLALRCIQKLLLVAIIVFFFPAHFKCSHCENGLFTIYFYALGFDLWIQDEAELSLYSHHHF